MQDTGYRIQDAGDAGNTTGYKKQEIRIAGLQDAPFEIGELGQSYFVLPYVHPRSVSLILNKIL